MIKLENLVKKFPSGDNEFIALHNIDLHIDKGEFLGFVGPSGSGKSTLLNIIGTLDSPSEGHAYVMGRDVNSLSASESARMRNENIGFIFQSFNLLPVYSVYENVEFALILQGVKGSERRKAVMDALEWTGLADKRDSRPSQLSGGECQRVAIARAIVKRPQIVLADEPSANLDAENTHTILKTMETLNKELGTTFLFATHDEKVMQYLQRTINLADGRIVKDMITESAANAKI